ncbi:MAG: D-alanine--D-alanine ligase family protein [Acidobacteriota bacterium]
MKTGPGDRTAPPDPRPSASPEGSAAPAPASRSWTSGEPRLYTFRQKPVFVLYNHFDPGIEEGIAERAVLETVEAVSQALAFSGRPVERVPLAPPLSGALRTLESLPRASAVFNLFEGFPGDPPSEVALAIGLRSLGLRATGCPPLALHLGLHKDVCKRYLQGFGLPTAPWRLFLHTREAKEELPFRFPVFLKPAAEDASHGIHAGNLVERPEDLEGRLRPLLERFPTGILAEPFLPGREFNCSVVETLEGPRVLPPSLVDYTALPEGRPPVLTFEAKWHEESEEYRGTPTLCPAPVEAEVRSTLERLALEAVEAVGFRGYARVDFREDAAGRPMILEVNPNPDLAPSAGLAKQARAAGWSYGDLVLEVLHAAEENEPWR